MGAWGYGTFENDSACDWTYELESTSDLSLVESTLDRVVLAREGYIDADVACRALAAAEVVARLKKNHAGSEVLNEVVEAWALRNGHQPPQELIHRAVRAIRRIMMDSSELRDLWEESGLEVEWTRVLSDQLSRLESP